MFKNCFSFEKAGFQRKPSICSCSNKGRSCPPGVDPLEPVKEESQSEKSDSDAEAPPLLKEHEV